MKDIFKYTKRDCGKFLRQDILNIKFFFCKNIKNNKCHEILHLSHIILIY